MALSSEFPPWAKEHAPGQFCTFPVGGSVADLGPITRTQNPMVVGTSVLGVTFAGGVAVAADMLGSYGSLARFKNISRVMRVNDCTVLACAGDYADYQYLHDIIEQMVIDDEVAGDGHQCKPEAIHSWLTRVLYNRRSKLNPLWNTILVGGYHDEESFLGYVDRIGLAYESSVVATGFGAFIALPLMRDAYEKNPNMSKDEALTLLERCLKILYYRDSRAFNRYEIAIVTKDGATILPPASCVPNWEIAHFVRNE
uniref:proteasome subunit beta type-4 isoform X2 n=1 Tax=Myxine glutinosa TaxID=7769 RepID=UPI00358DF28C